MANPPKDPLVKSAAPSIRRIAELQQLIAQFAGVERAYYLPGVGRRDADTDHSYGLALTCWFLQPKIAPELDLAEIFKLALAHDLVEIYAGDTYIYDEVAMKDKNERERAAIRELRNDWRDFPEMANYAGQYMGKMSEEAKFVKAVDKLLPAILCELSGKNEWERLDVTMKMQREDKVSMHVSSYISPYYDKLFVWLEERGNLSKSK